MGCTACGGNPSLCHHEPDPVLYCSVCEEPGADTEWELTDGAAYCYDCVSKKYKDQPVPPEWYLPDE